MEVALTKNEGFFDKGCPGERLITRVWFVGQLQAVRFPVVWGGRWATAFHVRVVLNGFTEQSLLSPVAHGISVA
jgi:hypothetical protein